MVAASRRPLGSCAKADTALPANKGPSTVLSLTKNSPLVRADRQGEMVDGSGTKP